MLKLLNECLHLWWFYKLIPLNLLGCLSLQLLELKLLSLGVENSLLLGRRLRDKLLLGSKLLLSLELLLGSKLLLGNKLLLGSKLLLLLRKPLGLES